MGVDGERRIAVLQEKDRWNEERNMQQVGRDENGREQARTPAEGGESAAVSHPNTRQIGPFVSGYPHHHSRGSAREREY